MQVSGIVNAPANASIADGSQPIALMGKSAELIVAELHGKYYTQAYRNNLFNGSTAIAGVTRGEGSWYLATTPAWQVSSASLTPAWTTGGGTAISTSATATTG